MRFAASPDLSPKSVKFLYGLGHPNFANKRLKFSLADLFPAHWQSDSYKLRLSATLYSVNEAQVNLTFQEGEGAQQYKILQGIFKGEEVHSNTINTLIANYPGGKDIRIISVMTVNKTYQLPHAFSLAIEIDDLKSMGYTGNVVHIGYSSIAGVTRPGVTLTNV